MPRLLDSLFLAASSLVLVAHASALDIPLRVQERAGVDHFEEIVTTGVPIPKGQLFSDQHVQVDATDGQFQTLATWSDGSVKWLLVSFVVKTSAHVTDTYHLVDGAGNTANGLTVTESAGSVTVDTGPLRFTLRENGFNLFDEVWLEPEDAAPYRIVSPRSTNGSIVEDPDGDVFTSAAAVTALTVEEAGPLRAVIHFRGTHAGEMGDHLEFSGRIYAHRGRQEVKVEFSETNMIPTATRLGQPRCRYLTGRGDHGGAWYSLFMEDLSLVMRADLPGELRYALQGDPEAPTVSGPLVADAWLYQDSSGDERWTASEDVTFRGYQMRHGGSLLGVGHQAAGFADLNNGSHGVTIAIRHFWENFPNKLMVSPDGTLTVGVMPRDFSAPFEHRPGERKTHWTLFYFHEGDEIAARSEDIARGFHTPLRAVAPAQWYVDSGAFDDLAAYDPGRFPDYELHNEIAASGFLEKRVESDYFGWMHFGDLWADQDGGDVPNTNKACTNLEYDTGFAFILQALRTAGIDDELSELWWKQAEEGNRHTADIDVYHVTEGPLQWLWGGMWAHTYGSGTDDPHRGSSPNSAHSWNRGMLNWYFLTGDRMVLDAAVKVGESIRWRILNGPGGPGYSNTNGEERAPGHVLQIMTDMYLFTWDDSYLEAARKVVYESRPDEYPQYASPDSGDWYTKPWMISILMKSLGRFASVMERERGIVEEDAIQSLLTRADFLEYRAWFDRSGDTVSYMPYKIWGNGQNDDPHVTMWSVRASDAFTWAARYEPDPVQRARYRQIAQHAFEDGSRHPWCQNCPNFEYMTAKVHQIVAGSGMEYMAEASSPGAVAAPLAGAARGVVLEPNRPNPFRRAAGTSISFRVPDDPAAGSISLQIFDVTGRHVRTLYEGPVARAEVRTLHWDGTDGGGIESAPGVYFYRLRTGLGPVRSRRAILLP